jgi:hypothetical protein
MLPISAAHQYYIPSETPLQTDHSFLQYRSKFGQLKQPTAPSVPAFQRTQSNNAPVSRPLSSTDETGPVQKRLRSTSRRPAGTTAAGGDPPKAPLAVGEDAPKKARARPALHLSNFFSSSGRLRSSQPKSTSTRTAGGGIAGGGGLGKAEREQQAPRRSTRLLGGGNPRTALKVKICSCRSGLYSWLCPKVLIADCTLVFFRARRRIVGGREPTAGRNPPSQRWRKSSPLL